MTDIRTLLQLAKRVQSPTEALALFLLSGFAILIIYIIPGDILEDQQ